MMGKGPWRTICHTCEDQDISGSYEEAGTFYDYHANQGHLVKMTNLARVDLKK